MSTQFQPATYEGTLLEQTALPRLGASVESAARLWLLLAIVWILSAGYAALELKRGWIPHDDGAFAQSAERVLNGELPHRDFDDTYTGGLAIANALAFRLFGVNLASLRFLLFGFFVLWIPAVFYIATRFAGAHAGSGLTFLAAAWSIPNYSAAVPSWYNLFFAVFGTASLLRYIETRARRWLFVAGLFAGLSMVVKIIGLYFVAAVILFLAFREQNSGSNQVSGLRLRNRVYSAGLVAGTFAAALALATVILRGPDSNGLVYFLLPACALLTMLVSREFSNASGKNDCRFTAFFGMLAPFGAGSVLPVLLFLLPYLRSHSVPALIRGVFILPARRFEAAAMAAPGLDRMVAWIPICLLLLLACKWDGKARMICEAALGLYLGVVLTLSASHSWAYRAGWFSISTAIPLVTVIAAIALGVPRISRNLNGDQQQKLMLLFSVLAMTSLVQFPFSAPVYFCYVAPVLILAAAALFGLLPRPPRLALGALMCFYLLFVIWRVTPAFVFNMGYTPSPVLFGAELNVPRGGHIRMDPTDAQMYEDLIQLIRQHAAGNYIYAGPDCAEIYFLTGLKNPTRTLFDSFDEPAGRTQRILDSIHARHISVLAFNEKPGFAGKINQDLEDRVQEDFPSSRQIGHFRVRWRE